MAIDTSSCPKDSASAFNWENYGGPLGVLVYRRTHLPCGTLTTSTLLSDDWGLSTVCVAFDDPMDAFPGIRLTYTMEPTLDLKVTLEEDGVMTTMYDGLPSDMSWACGHPYISGERWDTLMTFHTFFTKRFDISV